MIIVRAGGDELKLRGDLRGAVSAAIGRSLRGLKRDAGITIKHRYTISPGRVTRTITIKHSGLKGEMRSSGRRNALELFKIRPKRRLKRAPVGGVYAENVRGEGGYLRRGFVQRSGGVYERVSKRRFPLKKFSGPSAPGMLSSAPVSTFLLQKLEERLSQNLSGGLKV